MNGRSVRLIGLGVLALLLGCRPDASEESDDLALASAALGTNTQHAQQTPQSQLVLRRLWEGPRPAFSRMSVSPDGRLVSEMDWATGHPAVIDVMGGDRKRITDEGYGEWDYALTSVFSPDGRKLAHTYSHIWGDGRRGEEIRTIGVDGSVGRTIVPYSGPGFYRLKDWSDDGLHILATVRDEESKPPMRIGLISVVDGSIRYLKEYPEWGVESSVCVLSPDGRLVAYDLSSPEKADHDIFLLPVDGDREIALLAGPDDDRLLGWTPDGSAVLFYSDRGLTKGIWSLRISNGRAAGEPVLLRGDVWALEPIGFSRDAYYYGVRTQQPQVRTAVIDPQEWRLVTPPAAIEDPSLGAGLGWPAWSPDGRQLAYLRTPNGQGDPKLVIHSVAGDDSREIAVPHIEAGGLLRWTDDGRAVLIAGRDSLAQGVFKLDLDSGTAASIWHAEPVDCLPTMAVPFSRDLKTAYLARCGEDWGSGVFTIVARDLESGRERELATVGALQLIVLSHDGQTLAFVDGETLLNCTRIATVSTSGGEIREVYREGPLPPENLDIVTSVSWTPDGRHIVFAHLDAQTNRYSLWRIPAAGGERSRMELPFGSPPGLRMLRLNPDGNRIAFISGESRGEIWVMENLPGTR